MNSGNGVDPLSAGISPDKILATMEARFGAENSAHNNPLLTRLNQDSAQLAELAAVSHQLGPEGTIVPQVIGDFVSLHSGRASQSSGTNPTLDEALSNIQLGDEDEEGHNELDDIEPDDDDDVALNFNRTLSQHAESSSRPVNKDLFAAASLVDAEQLYSGSAAPWENLDELEPGVPEDDELDADDPALEELGLALAPKSKREKRKLTKKGAIVYEPAVQKLLGLANNAYVNKEYTKAVELYKEVIVKDARVFQAWNIMGVMQEELGNMEKALQLYLVAAHLTPKDGELWKKLAGISKGIGYNQQALYCFSKAYSADKTDMDALWDRSIMQTVMDQPEKAIRGFQLILHNRPHYMAALEELVKLYSSQSQDNKKYRENMARALELYEAAYLHYSSLPERSANSGDDPFDDAGDERGQEHEPFGYSALNMLSDLYIFFEEYQKPLEMIKTWSRRLQRRSHQIWWNDYKDDREFDTEPDDEDFQLSLGDKRTRGLPVDLRVKLGHCRLMMEEVKEAKAQFKYLWRNSVEDFPDLYEDVAELYVSKQMWKEGYNVLRAILQFDEMDIPKIWIMAGECLRHLRDFKGAKDYLEQAYRDDPTNVDVGMMLAEVHEEMGNLPQALNLVNYVRQINAERQAEVEKKRREAKMARDAKLNRDSGASAGAGPSGTTAPSFLLDPNYPKDARFRQLAPKPPQATFSLSAMGRTAPFTLPRSQDDVANDRAYMDEFQRAREQEYYARTQGRDAQMDDTSVVIEKFNRLETIHRRIDSKEKSRTWQSKREAIKLTRSDRTQYIQAARDLINIFADTKSIFPKEKSTPYLGNEARFWKPRKNPNDADNALSEHVLEMSERLDRMMNKDRDVPVEEPPVPTLPEEVIKPPTTFKDVPFSTWFMTMIRQAVYLTYEDRYPEAAQLLLLMTRANVFYQVPRRRSGIAVVHLGCAMWAGSCSDMIRQGRWLSSFGGARPFAIKMLHVAFSFGPRQCDSKFFNWIVSTTHKYLRRLLDTMRQQLGKAKRDPLRIYRNPRKGVRQPPKRSKKNIDALTPTLAATTKRFKPDLDLVTKRTYRRPQDHSRQKSRDMPVSFLPAATASKNFIEEPTSALTTEANGATALSIPAPKAIHPFFAKITSVAKEKQKASSTVSDLPVAVNISEPSVPQNTAGSTNLGVTFQEAAVDKRVAFETNEPSSSEQAPEGRRQGKKRMIVEEDEDGETNQLDEDGAHLSGSDGGEEDDNDDDDDDDDDAYRTEDDQPEEDLEEYDETEWEDDPDFPRPSYESGMSDQEQTAPPSRRIRPKQRLNPALEHYKRTHPKFIQGEFGEERTSTSARGNNMFTKPSFPKFCPSIVVLYGHILSRSRSHQGAAAHFADCLEYMPKNPMVHLYMAVQYLNVAMQRTTQNRQIAIAQALTLLQNYYRLRLAGLGTLAYAEREKKMLAAGLDPDPVPETTPLSKVNGKDIPDWKEQSEKASAESLVQSDQDPAPVSFSSVETSSMGSVEKDPSTEMEAPKRLKGKDPRTPAGPLMPGKAAEPPLRQCRQEAEFNFARGFHQIGQTHLAMIHYQRVLELPSWYEVEREERALAKQSRMEERAVRRQANAEARSARFETRRKKLAEMRTARESSRAQKAEAAKEKAVAAAASAASVNGEASGQLERVEEEEDDDDEDYDEDMDFDDEDEEDEESSDEEDGRDMPWYACMDGEDPTDLKREAAFNLAHIYLQGGAVGQAQLLMRKYCTV